MKNNILFIGAGRLGTTLAKAMLENGYSIPFFYNKTIHSKFNSNLPETEFITNLQQIVWKRISTIIITVPDDQIEKVVAQLAIIDISWENVNVIHTSGCLTSEKLKRLKSKGAITGSVHPMQSFNDYYLPLTIFNDIIFTIEADDQIYNYFKEIAVSLGAKTLRIKPEDKIIYHIAAVASSNFLVGLLDYTKGLYKKINFEDNDIKKLVFPIANQTLHNFKNDESQNVITGPLKRNDLNTIKSHVNFLKDTEEELLPIYKEISMYISQFILKKKGLDLEKIKHLLNK